MYKVTITVNVDAEDPQDARWSANDEILAGNVDVDSFEVEEIK